MRDRQAGYMEVTNSKVSEIPLKDDSGDTLRQDLDAVMEKVQLCQEMLAESPGLQEDEVLSDVVGFLEACRDRLADLIEAGSMGLLNEEMFGLTLKVNDAVQKTLDAEWVRPID